MNENKTTEKYIEWDLEKFKAGWPAEWHGYPAKFVAHVPEADSLSRLVFLWKGNIKMLPDTQGNNPYGSICLLARELDPHQCNKDGLYRDQVGEGWRIKGHDEEPKDGDEIWSLSDRVWVKRNKDFGALSAEYTYRTYRTRDPLSSAKVPLGPEDIILGKTVVRERGSSCEVLVRAKESYGLWHCTGRPWVDWDDLRNDYEISFDHGITWQKPEKDAKP